MTFPIPPAQSPGSSIAYSELPGSPEENFSRASGFSAVRKIKCAWRDRMRLARELMGGMSATGVLLPSARYDDNPAARVTDVKIRPFFGGELESDDGDDRKALYEQAELNITYKVPDGSDSSGGGDDSDSPESLVSETIDVAKEFMTLPSQGLYWSANSTSDADKLGDDASPGILIPMLVWSYTRRQLLSLPWAASDLVGHVNGAGMTSTTTGLSFAPETLLYESLSLSRGTSPSGRVVWDATFRFVHRATGWNRFFNPKTAEWATVYREDSSQEFKPYPLGNLRALQL